jgi:hypothetical protein
MHLWSLDFYPKIASQMNLWSLDFYPKIASQINLWSLVISTPNNLSSPKKNDG